MNQLVVQDEKSIRVALENSLYPGARKESIDMVLSYCRAARLDPMQKPVHIVPMSVKQGNDYVWRDVIMPGVGLYRIQADNSGSHAGTSEPEFGPMVKENLGGIEIEYPEWCKVVVKKLVGNVIAEYSAIEYWKENYATQKKDTQAPNAMWKKRPRGQLAKCAEAQALRKAFPQLGSQPTAEEMEGKVIDESEVYTIENNKPLKSAHSATSGALDGLDEDTQNKLRDAALTITMHFSKNDLEAALETYNKYTDADENAALRGLLESKVKTALRKLKEEKSMAAAVAKAKENGVIPQ